MFPLADGVTSFNLARLMVRPPSMLEAPANAACPPDLTANGHLVSRESSTAMETPIEELG